MNIYTCKHVNVSSSDVGTTAEEWDFVSVTVFSSLHSVLAIFLKQNSKTTKMFILECLEITSLNSDAIYFIS